jgi:elongation factor G
MIDIRATLIDGTSHEGEPSVPAFEIASRAAFREGVILPFLRVSASRTL